MKKKQLLNSDKAIFYGYPHSQMCKNDAFAAVEILQQPAIIRMTSSRTAAVRPRSQYFSKAIIAKGCILETKLL